MHWVVHEKKKLKFCFFMVGIPIVSKGFYISCEDLKPDFRYVLTPESETYNTAEGIRICGLLSFLTVEMPQLAGG